eukprot:COSAG06_NODE_63681_length_261_cov_1.580247_1_plen_86_part_11
MTEYYEHKYPNEAEPPLDVNELLKRVNQLQHQLTTVEKQSSLMRAAINDIGQYLCEVSQHLADHVTDTQVKMRFAGVKGLDGEKFF